MLKFFLLAVLAFAAFGSQDVPIPRVPDGYSLGSSNPTLHLEVFFDLLCPDCRDSWAILEPILRNEYNITNNQTMKFTVHVFSLLPHVNGLWVTTASRVIANNMKDPADMFKFINLMFGAQDAFYTTATTNLTQNQVVQNLINLISTNMPQYADAIKAGVQYGSQDDVEGRYAWKYACYRGVSGTPTFLANGVVINGAGDWLAKDWRNFLNGGYSRSKTMRMPLKPLRS